MGCRGEVKEDVKGETTGGRRWRQKEKKLTDLVRSTNIHCTVYPSVHSCIGAYVYLGFQGMPSHDSPGPSGGRLVWAACSF